MQILHVYTFVALSKSKSVNNIFNFTKLLASRWFITSLAFCCEMLSFWIARWKTMSWKCTHSTKQAIYQHCGTECRSTFEMALAKNADTISMCLFGQTEKTMVSFWWPIYKKTVTSKPSHQKTCAEQYNNVSRKKGTERIRTHTWASCNVLYQTFSCKYISTDLFLIAREIVP